MPDNQNHKFRDIAYHVAACIGLFADKHNLTRQEACRYMINFKGIEFVVNHYEVEHQLSYADCVADIEMICKRNGGMIA